MKIRSVKMYGTLLCVVILLVFLFSVEGSEEFPITTHKSDQKFPAIYGDYVVWQDSRNGNWDIYGFNLSTNEEFQITTHPADQTHPAIHGNIVVWEDCRCFEGDNCRTSPAYAIYGFNLSTKEEFPIITTPDWKSSFARKLNPAVYEDYVVWQDRPVGHPPAVCGINLSTRNLFQVSELSVEQQWPAIYEDYVVWTDEREPYTYGYNISTGEEFQIGEKHRFLFLSRGGYFPAIYDDMVIWLETPDCTIYGYDLSERKEVLIATASMEECWVQHNLIPHQDTVKPEIYKEYVVWVDCRNGNPDIYGFNLSEKEEFQIITHKSSQLSPALYETTVIWQDERNGNWDIYCHYLTPPLVVTSPSRTKGFLNALETLGFQALLFGIPGVLCALVVFNIGRSIWYWHTKKGTHTKVPAIPKDFKRNALSTVPFLVLAVLFAFSGYFSVINSDLSNGFISFGFCAFFIIFHVRIKRTPCIRIAEDEIVLFKVMREPEVINLDAIKDFNIRKWVGVPYRADLLLSDDTEEKIVLLSLNEKDKEELIQTIRGQKVDSP